MAIYQFYLAALPKKETIDFFGELPSKLGIEIQKGISSKLQEKYEEEFDYREVIQHKCWNLAKCKPDQIIRNINNKLNKADWGNSERTYSWKSDQKLVDNDAWISLRGSEMHIEEFTFRCDLRQPKLKFLHEMIQLAEENEMVLMDIKGNIELPVYDYISKLIQNSNAQRFMSNPKELIEDIENGTIEIEGKKSNR